MVCGAHPYCIISYCSLVDRTLLFHIPFYLLDAVKACVCVLQTDQHDRPKHTAHSSHVPAGSSQEPHQDGCEQRHTRGAGVWVWPWVQVWGWLGEVVSFFIHYS